MAAELHRLHDEWSIWHVPMITADLAAKHGGWEKAPQELTKCIDSISTVESFWGAFNAIPPATKLPKEETIMFFRKHCKPEWEDPAFKYGGRFVIRVDPVPSADDFVKDLLINLIGEHASIETGHVGLASGLRYQRKDSKKDQCVALQIWMTEAAKKDALQALIVRLAVENKIDNLLTNKDNLSFKPFTH